MTPAQRYAEQVISYLERLPRNRRADLVQELAVELLEYPEAETQEGLEFRVGPPAAYAASLAEDLGVRPGKRRRPRGWGWVPVALLPLVSIWLAIAFGSRPAAAGSVMGVGDFEYSIEDGGGSSWIDLVYQPDSNGEVVWSVRNQGFAELVLMDVGLFPGQVSRTGPDGEPWWRGLLVQEDVRLAADAGYDPATVDFVQARVSVPPNEERLVSIMARFDNCEHTSPGGSNTYGVAAVSYSYLGIRRVTLLELSDPISVTSPEVCDAPAEGFYANAAEALTDTSLPDWLPGDATEIRVAWGEAGVVARMRSGADIEGCRTPDGMPYWAYRPAWAPRHADFPGLETGSVTGLACGGGWFAWAPGPGDLLIWSDPSWSELSPTPVTDS